MVIRIHFFKTYIFFLNCQLFNLLKRFSRANLIYVLSDGIFSFIYFK